MRREEKGKRKEGAQGKGPTQANSKRGTKGMVGREQKTTDNCVRESEVPTEKGRAGKGKESARGERWWNGEEDRFAAREEERGGGR